MTHLPIEEQCLRLLLALLLGSLIGLEREYRAHAAGLRTHALVGMGSALIMLVSTYGFEDVENATGVSLDPSRIAAQAVSGIGFIGAGTIIVQRSSVRGLTTAASLWAVAAVGLAAGAGMYVAATAATIIALTVLLPMRYLEDAFHRIAGRPKAQVRTPRVFDAVESRLGGTRRYVKRQR